MTTVNLTHNLFVPGWILAVGVVMSSAPPLGVAASLGLFVLGVGVIPAAVLLHGARGLRALPA